MKPISYKQEMGTQKGFVPGCPHKVQLDFKLTMCLNYLGKNFPSVNHLQDILKNHIIEKKIIVE